MVRRVQGGTATRQRKEMQLTFQQGTLAPSDLKIEFS